MKADFAAVNALQYPASETVAIGGSTTKITQVEWNQESRAKADA
jgi:hypothetical protein